jgi:TIR domain-containing protein
MGNKRGRKPDYAYDVFISHKSEHKPWVEWLARALKTCGHSVFLDKWNLVPGNNWVEGLHRGIESSRAAVLVATPEVVNSGWVRQEYVALQRRRQANPDFRLVPIAFGELPNLPFLGVCLT